MSTLVCQDCGCKLEAHGFRNTGLPCGYFDDQSNCNCYKSQDEIRRAAAAKYLASLRRKRDKEYRDSDLYSEALSNIRVAIAAYRAVGILKGPKS